MKTFECIARNGNNGKQIVIFVRAYSSADARMEALKQAKQQFNGVSNICIDSVKEV